MPGVYKFEYRPGVWWKHLLVEFSFPNDKIELDNLGPTTAAEVVENLSEDNEKGVDIESPLEEQN